MGTSARRLALFLCFVIPMLAACSGSNTSSTLPGTMPQQMHTTQSSGVRGTGMPARSPYPNTSQLLDAGTACTFPVFQTVLSSNEVLKLYPPAANGDFLAKVTGSLKVEFTNTENNKSAVYNLSGPGQAVVHTDGSVSWISYGTGTIGLVPGDIPAGPDLVVFDGQLKYTVTAANQVIVTSFAGTATSVCTALS